MKTKGALPDKTSKITINGGSTQDQLANRRNGSQSSVRDGAADDAKQIRQDSSFFTSFTSLEEECQQATVEEEDQQEET